MRERSQVGPSGLQEQHFYPHGLRVRDFGDAFASGVFLGVSLIFMLGFGRALIPSIGTSVYSFFNAVTVFMVLVLSIPFGLFVWAVHDLLLTRPFYVFVSDNYFGVQDRRGRHQWEGTGS